ncbi:MAG: efflux RND transporter periplasmic adaptor subunit [Prolixibacteraceae bacterium]|jgi:RND family efflux transporter MFP subunit|nr:efflux RND transporter periplasmic adaptor subunit [Prolixibacteraceae bacterium]MDD4755728.1 efflux RND transporter periplasmic adaptor subunit [Prolixibacteraceae bacterium]NLO01595.1 efflux RND transporter periplasmic adaptor subunit [Bacteroidales bacterium]
MNHIKFLTITLAAVTLSSCMQNTKKDESNQSSESPKKEMVKVMQLQYRTVARSVEYPATFEAYEEVHMVPASPGRIEEIHGEIGDRVSKGTPLVQMDRTQLHQAEIQLKNLELDFRRLDTLAKYGSIAQQQYDQLKTQYEVAMSNVEFLRENTRLLAPFNGVISGRYFEAGEMFSGTPNTQAGKAAVLSIVQIDRLKAMVAMSENYFPMVKKGMETSIKIDTYNDQNFTGQVFRIHPTINPMDRTFNVEVLINNRENLLRPGMFCRVTFDLDEEEAILLPSIAVLKMQGSNERFLFVNENGIAKRISVTIGKRYDDDVEVFSDELEPGDQVIVTGQARLLDGIPVEVVN